MVKPSNTPEFVFKAFQAEEFATQFINEGIFRIGNLYTYRAIEDELRKDPAEGEASYMFEEELQQVHCSQDSAIVGTSTKKELTHVSGSWGNPTYIFCASLPTVDVEYLRKRFGKFIVKINNQNQLMADMQEAIVKTDYPFIGKGIVRGRHVHYTKGGVLAANLEEVDSCELATFQKPPEFSPENEYRFIAMMSAIKPPEAIPKFVLINIERKLNYAHLC